MKKILLVIATILVTFTAGAQSLDPIEFEGQSCTSIMVGRKASKDGSVITSHTCDGRYRTWMCMEPAADHPAGSTYKVYKGTAHTTFKGDTTGVRLAGEIPEVAHTYAYLNTAYPCMNEHQLAIGETTFGGPDTLVNKNGMFQIEELQRIVLQRCTKARDAVLLIGELIKKYGYGDGGECITIADKNEIWQMEILGEGPDKIGGVWAAQRVPDDHVAVSANIPRIGRLLRGNPESFLCSSNCEDVAIKYGLWDGNGPFVFWKAFNCSYANGKNYREREFFIFSTLAPSQEFSQELSELPFSIQPDAKVDVRQVIDLFRSTYEGTDMDMCQNVKMVTQRKDKNGKTYNDTIISPVANPWLGGNMQKTLNYIAPGTIDFKRTVSVAWCSYSHIIQLRSWLPDAVGGVCWMSVDNPAQTPRVPIFCGTTQLPKAYSICGQKRYNENAVIWKYRKANKLATVAWQRTKGDMMKQVMDFEDKAFAGLDKLQKEVTTCYEKFTNDDATLEQTRNNVANLLNAYTYGIYDETAAAWHQLEEKYWMQFGMGF